ncbi:DEAD/DEAH box helicase domain-containing protein [Cellulophaga geojensis KL-A]|uniref:DEAD/DEAH box helicase domain-containing protein n=1 Tax=Cellulophaga geojensis KL-A TaxID=1328323 RepID=A0ABP3B8U1_9FLAO|nr:DEAD/DEAH box helicase [Cellulophaga geojensis]EWH13317.1 DEAD/DEAH box helicase domain-containing protein [Cellulophaga geojensis KL-A]
MTIIEKLTKDVLNDEYFKLIFSKCSLISAENNLNIELSDNILTNKELTDALRFSDILSNSKNSEARNKAYQIITYLNHQFKNNEIYRTVSKAVYSKLGNFPAINYLTNYNANIATLPFFRSIEVEAKKVIQKVPDSENFVFTDSQFELYSQLSNTLEYSFSGPTSMGKSFIIKAFIKKVMRNSPPENLVIIVPTRALINQFTLDLKDEIRELSEQYKYRILTNSNVNGFIGDEPHNYILILTPERLISYLSQDNNPPIGFVFVDEAHKLANEKDSRSVTTYTAIEKTIKKYGNIKLYFSSPNVSNPEVFLKLFDRNKPNNTFKTNESPVSQNLFFIDLLSKNVELIQKDNNVNIENSNLFQVVNSTTTLIQHLGFDKNNLIYCNSKSKTIFEANEFSKIVGKFQLSEALKKAIKQIKEYIHPQYYLANLLEHKVAFHYGKLPQLIRNLVEDLYKKEEIQNVFCTSTLLEGVNMPTQNIFILNGKNGRKPLSQIDFWNLSGRAGRLSKELYGNIFCVQHSDWLWENKEILNKTEIILKPTVLTKIDRNLRKIESILKNQKITGSKEEQAILRYIANIISVDTLEIKSNYKSPLIEKLIEKKKDKIIELANSKVKDFEIPSYILNSNQSINLTIQNKVFNLIKKAHKQGKNIKLISNHINYEICLDTLKNLYILYEWDKAEKKLNNEKSLKYYALLMNQWINGFGLNQIIKMSIEHYENNRSLIHLGYIDNKPNFIQYEKGNVDHINALIEKIIEDIEYVLRFLFEKYFNHYYQVISNILGEDSAGENWASLLEYGTQNRIAIALQNIGLSRHTALAIYRKCRRALNVEEDKLKSINKNLILSEFKNGTLEYDEINRIL